MGYISMKRKVKTGYKTYKVILKDFIKLMFLLSKIVVWCANKLEKLVVKTYNFIRKDTVVQNNNVESNTTSSKVIDFAQYLEKKAQ